MAKILNEKTVKVEFTQEEWDWITAGMGMTYTNDIQNEIKRYNIKFDPEFNEAELYNFLLKHSRLPEYRIEFLSQLKGGDTVVILYSTGCSKCKILKEKLDSKSITYQICDDTELMIQKGFRSVPMLEVDGVLMDFLQANNWIKEI